MGVVLDLSLANLLVEDAVFLGGSTLVDIVLWGVIGGWFLEPWSKERDRSISVSWSRAHRVLLAQLVAMVLLVVLAWVWELSGWQPLSRPEMIAGALLILGSLFGAVLHGGRVSGPWARQ